MIAIIDYGVGNLRSVQKALEKVGRDARITASPQELRSADGVILPGVGAFGDGMRSLLALGFVDALQAYVAGGKPLLGICLGMQLLFSSSDEHGFHKGLDLMPGHVRKMQGEFKIPQVGWNQLQPQQSHPLIDGITAGEYAYFVHSYYVDPVDPKVVIAKANYHIDVPAIVAYDHIYGMQFHPEKSSATGLRLLDNFASLCEREATATC